MRHDSTWRIALGSGLLGLLAARVAGSAPASAPTTPPTPRSATVPFILDHNRMIVDVELLRPNGVVRPARAWVDTGNQFFLLAEPLARELGIAPTGATEQGAQYDQGWADQTPRILLAGLPLDVVGIRAKVLLGARAMPGVPVEVNLPASVFRHDHVVFDYPGRRLTVARPGVLKPVGTAIPCRVNRETGLFQIAATLGGTILELGVDNGSAFTWLSNTLTTAWQARHSEWPLAVGAAGAANFFGFPFETKGVLMRLPELGIGPLHARAVGVLGLPQELFDWFSKKSAGPVVGLLGANVLKGFRVEVDYPSSMTYWVAGPAPEPNDLDIVGLTLRPEPDGGFTVVGVVEKGGAPTVAGVEAGDRLIRIDALETANASMGAVVDALRGTPGTRRNLFVERKGKRMTVEAVVSRLP
jgi:hypothetical protein